MLMQAAALILETVFHFFLFAVLVRFLMQWTRAPFRHPFGEFIIALTDFAVRPLRRLMPGYWGIDFATLFVAWLTEFLLLFVLYVLQGAEFGFGEGRVFGVLALLALVALLRFSIYLVMGVVLVQAILSWVNPYNPLAPVLSAVSRPFTRMAQRVLPPIANVDLSPLVVLLVCQLLLIVPVGWLESQIRLLLVA